MGRRPLEIDQSTLRGKIAVRIRRERQKHFSTQQEFLDALAGHGLNVTKGTVSNWESGKHLPDIETLYAIAPLLHKKPHDFLP